MTDEDPIRGYAQQSIPTVRELAMVLFRQRRVFVCAAGLVFRSAVLYAVTGTTYQASMKILVRRGRADAPVSSGENAPLDLTHLAVTEEELNSEVELLRDNDVLRRVVEETGIGDPQKAARVLRALENAYLEKHLNVHRPNGELRFFTQQTAESKRQLDETKEQLLRFTTQHQVVSAGLLRDQARWITQTSSRKSCIGSGGV